MPARPPLPADDLYARLGVPSDASREAIDVAWRGLLRRHHPDVAGPDALDLAKRINVAHDWLSDPELRGRYDRERGVGIGVGRHIGGSGDAGVGRDPTGRPAHAQRPRRPPTLGERVAAVIERVTRLSVDDLDRLSFAEPAPIAFLATLRRFASPDLQAALDAAEREAFAALPRAARSDPAITDAIAGRLADLILGDTLEELLGEPAGSRARERLTRGWDAAVGQPRYGPATVAVEGLLGRLAGLSERELRALAGTGGRDRLSEDPWPGGTSAEEDEVLRVSSGLASRDAAAAVSAAPGAALVDGSSSAALATMTAARRAAARVAHLLVLRHAIRAAEFDRLAAPWLGDLVPRVAPWGTRARHGR
jgi:curved DNA-binding protein CbpA